VTSLGTLAAIPAQRTRPRSPLSGPLPDLLRRRAATVTAVLLVATVVAYGALVLQRAWISDDGLIFLRTVRQVLAGHGPVFNVGERVEANTSTLWTLVLLGLALVPGVRLELLSVGACAVLSVVALGLALDASRRFAALGRVVVPAGRWWSSRCRRSGTSAPPGWRPR
jgi:arabinofuranosyltransferase